MVKLLVLAVSLFAAPLQDAGVSGVWDVKLSADWTTMPDLVCKLRQKGQALSGSCKAAGDEKGKTADIVGTVQGNKINCEWKVTTPDGATWSFELAGTADERKSQIKGAFKISNAAGAVGDGTFLATRQ